MRVTESSSKFIQSLQYVAKSAFIPCLTGSNEHLLAIAIALLPAAALAEQFTPEQMLDVMTKSPESRDVRVHDAAVAVPMYPFSSRGPMNYPDLTARFP